MIERINERLYVDDHDCSDSCIGDFHPDFERYMCDVRRMDTFAVILRDVHYVGSNLPPGAMWYEYMREDEYLFDDGDKLLVMLPNKEILNLDSRAGNCPIPHDYEHRCWAYKGEVPNITVYRSDTSCNAGGGSIALGDFHGFLDKGRFSSYDPKRSFVSFFGNW